MPASDLVNLSGLMDDAKCFALLRQHRWPEGARCPGYYSSSVIQDACDHTQAHRQDDGKVSVRVHTGVAVTDGCL